MCLAPCSPGSLDDSARCRLPTHTLFSYRDARKTLVCSADSECQAARLPSINHDNDSTRSCSKSPQSSCIPSRLPSAPVPGWFACPGETCMHAARSKRSEDGVQYRCTLAATASPAPQPGREEKMIFEQPVRGLEVVPNPASKGAAWGAVEARLIGQKCWYSGQSQNPKASSRLLRGNRPQATNQTTGAAAVQPAHPAPSGRLGGLRHGEDGLGQAISFVPRACLLAGTSRSCPGSRQRSRVSCSSIETEPSLSSGGRQMLALVLLELAAGALDGVSRESRASTSWFSTLPNNESTFPKGRLGSGGSPPGVISLLATERLTGGGMQREFQQTIIQDTRAYHSHRAKTKRIGLEENHGSNLHVPGPQEGIPRHAPPAPFNSRWRRPSPARGGKQTCRLQPHFRNEPWPYGSREPLIR